MEQEEQEKRQPTEDNQGSQGPWPCEYCGSGTREDRVKAAFWGERGWLIVEDIPARVCEGCGEQFYDEETTRKITELTTHGFPAEKANRKTVVPVFSLAEL